MSSAESLTAPSDRDDRPRAQDPSPLQEGREPPRPPPPLSGSRVLVADDDPVSQQVVQHLLQTLGLEVEVVDDGAQAVARIEQDDWDLVFLDCEMPVLDGCDAARAIRALAPRLPLVALTASELQADARACREAGMEEVLTKPIHLDHLREVVTRLLTRDRLPPKEAPSR